MLDGAGSEANVVKCQSCWVALGGFSSPPTGQGGTCWNSSLDMPSAYSVYHQIYSRSYRIIRGSRVFYHWWCANNFRGSGSKHACHCGHQQMMSQTVPVDQQFSLSHSWGSRLKWHGGHQTWTNASRWCESQAFPAGQTAEASERVQVKVAIWHNYILSNIFQIIWIWNPGSQDDFNRLFC